MITNHPASYMQATQTATPLKRIAALHAQNDSRHSNTGDVFERIAPLSSGDSNIKFAGHENRETHSKHINRGSGKSHRNETTVSHKDVTTKDK